jgi:DNA mismatch repair protein MutS2
MIYPSNFEVKTGFDRIRNHLKELCLSPLGIAMVDEMRFSSNFQQVLQLLNLSGEFKKLMLDEEAFPDNYFFDLTKVLHHLRIEGTFPEVEEMFNLRRSLETIKAVYNFLNSKNEVKYPNLKLLIRNVKLYPFVTDRINAIVTNNGKIKDNASPELSSIRHEIHRKEQEVAKRMHQLMKLAQSEGWAEEGASLSVHDGRLVIPVNSTHKRRIKGFVHDESSTGKTSFIEPAEVVELNNELKELEYSERREIVKILTDFANDIRPYIDDLLIAYNFLGEVDFLRAKSLYSIEINAIQPPIFENPQISWYNAVHPLLMKHLKAEGKSVVPLDIQLNDQKRILVISGPNAGGKSVCLQTVGLIQYMLQCGLLIPVKETSETGIFEKIFIDIGDEQSIENDLSTYSSHLLNMKFFIRNANDKCLFMVDEFGAGTEPMLGGAIAESVLEELNQIKSFGIVTTHYTNLKHFASSADGIINGAMLYDAQNLQPLFKLLIGEPGSSFAFEIARKIGLPENILQNATQKVGEGHIDYDRNLKEIIRDKHYWQQKRNQVKESGKRLDEVVLKYSTELEEIKQLRKEVLQKAKLDAQELLTGVNKQIENTIREIKESQADKEKTKIARLNVIKIKDKVEMIDSSFDEKIEKKIEQLSRREERKNKRQISSNEEKSVVTKIEEPDLTIRKGDKVKLFGQSAVGEVLDINGKSILVSFGNMVTTLHEKRLEKISDNEFKKARKLEPKAENTSLYNVSERKQNFKLQLDVRGMRADEALQIVSEYIDEAIMVDVNEVRILHGKGNGILRQLIRDYLNTIDLITFCGDEHVQFGGAGITVVKF